MRFCVEFIRTYAGQTAVFSLGALKTTVMSLKVALLSLLMGIAAGAGLAWLVINRPPTNPNLATAMLLLALAVTGLLAPLLGWLHRRIPFGGRPPTARAALRQALLLGLAVALIAILQLRGLLDGTLVLGVLALAVLVEVFAQSRRERA
jgi:hypothetical protein